MNYVDVCLMIGSAIAYNHNKDRNYHSPISFISKLSCRKLLLWRAGGKEGRENVGEIADQFIARHTESLSCLIEAPAPHLGRIHSRTPKGSPAQPVRVMVSS